MIASTVMTCPRLEILRLTQSRIEDEQMRVIIRNLLKHPSLKVLDLKHNRLKDRTGRALGKVSIFAVNFDLLTKISLVG